MSTVQGLLGRHPPPTGWDQAAGRKAELPRCSEALGAYYSDVELLGIFPGMHTRSFKNEYILYPLTVCHGKSESSVVQDPEAFTGHCETLGASHSTCHLLCGLKPGGRDRLTSPWCLGKWG